MTKDELIDALRQELERLVWIVDDKDVESIDRVLELEADDEKD